MKLEWSVQTAKIEFLMGGLAKYIHMKELSIIMALFNSRSILEEKIVKSGQTPT